MSSSICIFRVAGTCSISTRTATGVRTGAGGGPACIILSERVKEHIEPELPTAFRVESEKAAADRRIGSDRRR